MTVAYDLVRNTVVVPSAALGGALRDFVSPEVAFALATAIGHLGTGYFLAVHEEFETSAESQAYFGVASVDDPWTPFSAGGISWGPSARARRRDWPGADR